MGCEQASRKPYIGTVHLSSMGSRIFLNGPRMKSLARERANRSGTLRAGFHSSTAHRSTWRAFWDRPNERVLAVALSNHWYETRDVV